MARVNFRVRVALITAGNSTRAYADFSKLCYKRQPLGGAIWRTLKEFNSTVV